MRVFVKDGVVVREEPSGSLPVIEPAGARLQPDGVHAGHMLEPVAAGAGPRPVPH